MLWCDNYTVDEYQQRKGDYNPADDFVNINESTLAPINYQNFTSLYLDYVITKT